MFAPLFSLGASSSDYVNCAFLIRGFIPMNDSFNQTANGAAEHIVRHFQAKGFTDITEALIIQIRSRGADRKEVEAAFEAAHEQDKMPPVLKYFEIHPYGHFSDFRSFEEAKSAINSDLTMSLRSEIPRVFFDPAPVVIEDALASGTKYDVIMKLKDNVEGYAIAVLMNDPDASFLDYIGTHHGKDWQEIMNDFEIATAALGNEIDLH